MVVVMAASRSSVAFIYECRVETIVLRALRPAALTHASVATAATAAPAFGNNKKGCLPL